MFFDDINGLTLEISHLNSLIGYIGDELPSFYGDSLMFCSEDQQKLSFENLILSENKSGILTPLLEENKIKDFDNYMHFIDMLTNKIGT